MIFLCSSFFTQHRYNFDNFCQRPTFATAWAIFFFFQSQHSTLLPFKRTAFAPVTLQSRPFCVLLSSEFFLPFCSHFFHILKFTFQNCLLTFLLPFLFLHVSETLMLDIQFLASVVWNTFDMRKKRRKSI